MKLIPLSKKGKYAGLYFAQVDDEDFERMNKFNWHVMGTGGMHYAAKTKKKTPMHRILINPPEDKEIDHIDGNGLNNQKSNLRTCDRGENCANRIGYGKSGYKGVFGVGDRWRVRLVKNKKVVDLGCFTDIKQAALAYNNYATKLHGSFAKLNIIN